MSLHKSSQILTFLFNTRNSRNSWIVHNFEDRSALFVYKSILAKLHPLQNMATQQFLDMHWKVLDLLETGYFFKGLKNILKIFLAKFVVCLFASIAPLQERFSLFLHVCYIHFSTFPCSKGCCYPNFRRSLWFYFWSR